MLKDTIEEFLSSVWLLEQIFWKLHDPLMYNNRLEDIKNALKNIYWYKDVDYIFRPQINEKRIMKTLTIVMKLQQEPTTPERKKFLWLF